MSIRRIAPASAESWPSYFNGLASLGWASRRPNFVLFLGSSVGNFSHAAALRFFRRLRESLRPGDFVLVGFDLKKDLEILHRAYNDSEGVTRLFNLNLLDRINRELGGEFDLGRFAHYGAYNMRKACMESWLVSLENQEVPIHALGRSFSFREWEGIHVERSHKYELSQIESFASAAGFRVQKHFSTAAAGSRIRCGRSKSCCRVPGGTNRPLQGSLVPPYKSGGISAA